ncbi:hypothetical protein ASPCAL08780 [Aspergillus calidoustus]|uniref:Uncharacterized protein n=1 Tax=Aspergillus calidoustus TaxID=454130 RepID=A0A0U5CQV2_ASPCI|nr:hypothetical protein ASPCAL08780 [Aspergillus calidoustus]
MLLPPQIRGLITGIFRRQSTDSTSGLDSANVPNQCFDACNSAALEAQATNNIDIICAPNSVFLDLRYHCTTCLERFIAADNGTASQQDLGPTF